MRIPLLVTNSSTDKLSRDYNSKHCIPGSNPASGPFRNKSKLPGHVMAPTFTEEAALKTLWEC